MRRAAVIAALVALPLALAGCGSSDVASAPASSAGVLTPGAVVYWHTVSDPDSPQWQQAEDLLKRFPDGDKWIAQLRKQIEDEGVTWDGDVRPALGSVVDVAVYRNPSGDQPCVVGLTNPKDKAKARTLVDKLNAKSDRKVVMREVGDWIAISDSETSLDVALKGTGQSLADDEAFKSGMDDLPDDALSSVYVDPARALELAPAGMEGKTLGMFGLDKLDFAGAWAKAKAGGAELAFALRGEGADRLLGTGEPYSSKLLEKVPDDAFLFLSFQGGGLRGQLQQLRDNPLFATGIRSFEREYGIDVNELIALLDGEIAFYARPAVGPLPELTLLLDSQQPERAKASLETIVQKLFDQLGRVQLTVGSLDGTVVVSTSRKAVADLQEAGDKLAESDRYTKALDAAGVPDQYTGLAYVDVTEMWDLIRSYLGFGGDGQQGPPELSRNLEPLKSFVAFGKQDGSLSTFLAFLEID